MVSGHGDPFLRREYVLRNVVLNLFYMCHFIFRGGNAEVGLVAHVC